MTYTNGDWVVITTNGSGTACEDIGLICRVCNAGTIKKTHFSYNIEIDRDKIGNKDRWTSADVLRPATQEEIERALQMPIYAHLKKEQYEIF